MPRSRLLVVAFATALVVPVLAATVTAPATGVTQGVSAVSTADLSIAVAPRVRQRAKLLMHPQIADVSTKPKAAAKAKSAMTGQFKPRKRGRPVALQGKVGKRWVTIQKKKMAGNGRVEFAAPFKVKRRIQTYRVVALRHDGLAPKASKGAKTNKWGKHDFKDEFGGTALRSAWQNRVQGYGATPDRSCSETGTNATRSVGGGMLKLFVKNGAGPGGLLNDRCVYEGRDYAWRQNGHISTDAGRYQFQYGYVAARMRFHRLPGQHASFWLQPGPAETAAQASDPGTEIDVIEWFGNRQNNNTELSAFVHRNGTKVGGYIKNTKRYGKDWYSNFHVFSVEWTPMRYVFRIDGKQVFTTRKFVSHRPEFLILSNLSSDYELKFLPGAKEDQLGKASTTTQVDWVRVWKR